MSLFRAERRTDYPTGSLQELFDRRRGPLDTAGVPVDQDTALRMSAVWACRDLIGSTISTLPLDEFRRGQDGTRVPLDEPPVFVYPDGVLDREAWLYQVIDSMLMWGNAYGLILERDAQGWPSKILMLEPSLIQVEQRGRPLGEYTFKLNGKAIRRFDPLTGAGDLWHTPAYLRPGSPIGLSCISYGALSIGVNLAAQEFGGKWFRDGAVPSAILSNVKPVNKTTAQLVKARWMDAMFGNREPVVMGDDWKYMPVSVPAEESQFLATIRASVADVARYFRVPPSEIGAVLEGDSQTYSNDEQRSIGLLKYTLNPWVIRLERSLTGLRPRGRFMKFNVDAFLRTDLKTRYTAHDLSIRDGWRSVDEVRAIEDEAPLPDGEGGKYLWPPLRQQLTEEELGSGEPIEGGVDDSEEGGQSGASQGAA